MTHHTWDDGSVRITQNDLTLGFTTTTTTAANLIIGGGGFSVTPNTNPVYITNNPTYYTGGLTTTTTGYTFGPNISLPNTRRSMLTPEQWNVIMRGHEFLPMADTGYCLICWALDEVRGPCEHLFVIHEE